MTNIPQRMSGVQLTGHGGLDRLLYRDDLPTPAPRAGEVLIRVRATSVNNTVVNTRVGWYSKKVAGATAVGAEGYGDDVSDDASWSGAPLTFPRIQGADCYGEIVAAGEAALEARIGERVLVRTMMRAPVDFAPFRCWTFGSECDGGFADYVAAPSADVFAIESDLDDASLGAIPCAFSTAEGMLHRTGVSAGERVLVTGASGGGGSAAVQLALLRGADVVAVASPAKSRAVGDLGASTVIPRDAAPLEALGRQSVDVVVDLVGRPTFERLPELLARGGRYVTAGAIAGPAVNFDLRTLYLNDLTFFGCAFQDDVIFENLVAYLRDGQLAPHVEQTFALKNIRDAQARFLKKDFVGKLALIP
ncbi:MAG: zinc-binding dehydrogenase [Parvularculaceae bacterium]